MTVRSLLLTALLLGTSAVAAQPSPVCVLHADAPEAQMPPLARGGGGAVFEPCDPTDRTAEFDLDAEGLPIEVRTALQAALDVWSCQVVSSVPIRITATWRGLGAQRLGSAGPRALRDASVPVAPETWVPFALADALVMRDLGGATPDIEAEFNSSFADWWLDPQAPVPATDYDFATVALHEIGHGLGLLGAFSVEDRRGFLDGPNGTDAPLIYDRFTESGDGTPLLDRQAFPQRSRALGDVLTSEATPGVQFDGSAARQVGGPLALYAPSGWLEGGSYDHLDEVAFAAGTPEGLMTPFLARGERITTPGASACAMLADIGWTLAGDCAAAVGPTISPSAPLSVSVEGGNPFASRTSVAIRVSSQREVTVTLVDALGRSVRHLFAGRVEPGTPQPVAVSGEGLSAGFYLLVVESEGRRVSQALVRR